jgi:hypothetical protein
MVKVRRLAAYLKGNMVSPAAERNQPVLLESAEPLSTEPEARIKRPAPSPGFGFWAMSFAIALSAFWIGTTGAYLLGYLGPAGIAALPLPQATLIIAGALLPPLLVISAAWSLTRGAAMARAATALADATENLFAADEGTVRTAARLGRAVRRELDALNAGLDAAFARMRALEGVLEQQIAAVDEAGARIDVRGEAVAARLTQERERMEGIATALSDAASRASETVAGRSAQLKATIESAESALKSASQALDVQATSFRQAAQLAAEAPKNAVVELDTQAKRIESVSDAAMARAEFVLGRHERHRSAMTELLQRLKDETSGFENALSAQRTAMEATIGAVGAEAMKFQMLTGDSDRKLDLIMANASARAIQLAQSYAREVERLKESSDASNVSLARLVDAMREAGLGAQALIGETTNQAKTDAKALVGEAMAECERLLRAAGEMSIEAGSIRETLANAVQQVERHISALPSIALQEAQRVRELVRAETEEMLDLSARTLSTIHARSSVHTAPRSSQQPTVAIEPPESEGDGLLGLARKLTQRQKRKSSEREDLRRRDGKPDGKSWEMSELLAAANGGEPTAKDLKGGSAAALGALEAVLADLAINLDALVPDSDPTEDSWRRYLQGDRAVFARRLADAIDERAVDRITALYRDDQQFREAANHYIAEFEGLLARASEGDAGGLLASTMLSADTGKIYLAVAYALGRL